MKIIKNHIKIKIKIKIKAHSLDLKLSKLSHCQRSWGSRFQRLIVLRKNELEWVKFCV